MKGGARVAAWLLLLGCEAEATRCEGDDLFGIPNEYTGLDSKTCRPTCENCGSEGWSPPAYGAREFADWRSRILLNSPATPASDPYLNPPPATPASSDAVCAVETDPDGYRLADYPSPDAAREAGASPTHFGSCGLCSPLADLAVYAENPELTEPVRACGLSFFAGPPEDHVACLLALGFTEPCAWIWYYNTVHTREACGAVCLAALDDPWNLPDGSLNECLACDEEESADVFAAVAGRTRRNTGLASSICRPCGEVRPLDHSYP